MSENYDYLIDHALKNVWSTPRQDRQSVMKLPRITPPGGVWNKVKILWDNHKLPEQGVRFHVYQIGQLHPLLIGLFPKENTWVTLAEACTRQNLIVDLYNNAGVEMPRTQCWYKITENKNLVIAVKEQLRIPFNLDTDDLFFRVYTNAYYQSSEASIAGTYIKVEGSTPLNTQAILDLQAAFITAQARPGLTYAFVNGFRVSTIDLFTVQVGDVVEFIYDGSVKKTVDFTVKDLRTFDSIKDEKRKYLLHYAGLGESVIDFHDDIDVFVLQPLGGGRYKGVYYHRNQEDAMRMVTHKDYSLPVAYVLGYATANGWTDPDDLIVRLHVRKAGWRRPLVYEANRIHELYKLSDANLRDAMLGLHSTLNNWRADVLENSDYTTIMATDVTCLSKEIVDSAYGYNSISKILADTPKFTRIESQQEVIDVPYGLFQRSTGYEYDDNGLLIGWNTHLSGSLYPVRYSQAKLVELLAGLVDERLDEVYGDQEVTLDPTASYRMYLCDIVNGSPTNVWRDVTGSGNYVIIDNKLTWLVNLTQNYPLVRSDRVMLGYSVNLDASDDGLLQFSLSHLARRNNTISRWVMQVPMGELDLWLNNRALIENVDYFVNFPEVTIVNKEYQTNPLTQTQKVTVRFSGFCKTDLSREIPADQGFIKYGLLSRNTKFDLRDDKVLRIVVDGKLYERSELKFSEEDSGVTVPDVSNGRPYLIRDIVVPMRAHTAGETYAMRAQSRVIDQAVSDYLTTKIPEPTITSPNIIPARYQVYSPFCCKILNDLKNGVLDDPRLVQQYNDLVVQELCEPYLPLLEADPTQEELEPDPEYVEIHPHNLLQTISISIYHWKFLQRAIKLYLRDKVNLSHFVTIES